jgi:CelD/BcsL family acetyltransferase involved in cellulose biosynthesis
LQKKGAVTDVTDRPYNKAMKTEMIQTKEEFLLLRDEWNALLATSVSGCIFLTHEWLSAWWKHLAEGRRLSILLAHEGGELAGILPLAEREAQYARLMPRVLEFLGSGVIGSDYLDAIVGQEREREAIAAFAEHLNGRARMLQLGQLRGGSCIVSLLAEELRQSGWTADETKLNVCPYINLGGHTWESYLATLGPQVRKRIKRCLGNLPRTFEFRVVCVRAPAEAQRGLDILIELHRKRWGAGRKSEAFQSPSVIAFHREFVELAAARGWLRLLIIYLNGVPAAGLYGLRYGPAFYFYQSGFDPAFSKQSVGVAAMALAIKMAIEEGCLEYDFLHGNEEYKFHWARETRDLTRIELHPPRARAWIYKRAIGFNRAARQMARRVLQRASNVALSR